MNVSDMAATNKSPDQCIYESSLTELPAYEYGPPLRSDQIRLLKLESGSPGSPISFSLITEDRGHSKYRALSYAWGVPVCDRPARCNGCRLTITASLADALSRLRRKYADEYLWVDAICINQADPVDKSKQVREMSTIYHEAESVIVWLGEESESTGTGVKLLADICASFPSSRGDYIRELDLGDTLRSNFKQNGRYTSLQPASISTDWYNSIDGWDEALHFFDAAWFERRWILQEVTNARDCVFHIGDHETTPEILLGGAYRLARMAELRNTLTSRQRRHCDHAVTIVQLMRAEQEAWLHQSLPELLLETAFFQSSDPRDRIFAVIGCLKDCTDPVFWDGPRKQAIAERWEVAETSAGSNDMVRKLDNLVDYTKSLQDVLTDVALFEEGSNEFVPSILRNLCYVDVLQDAVPSWIPTWQFSSPGWASLYSEPQDPLDDRMYKADQVELSVLQDRSVLRIGAILFDTITSVSEPDEQLDIRIQASERAEALATDDATIISRYSPTRTSDPKSWTNNKERLSLGRQSFVSRCGKTGWVPAGAKAGDELCVISGFATPFTVRKVEHGESHGAGRYMLLGASYVVESMDGEVFLDDSFEQQTIRFI